MRTPPAGSRARGASGIMRGLVKATYCAPTADRAPERLRGFQIDHKLGLRDLFHGKVRRLRTSEDLVDIFICAACWKNSGKTHRTI